MRSSDRQTVLTTQLENDNRHASNWARMIFKIMAAG